MDASTSSAVIGRPGRPCAGLKFYAEPQPYAAESGVCMAGSIALICRQKPGSFTQQGETMGFTRQWPGYLKKSCPHVSLQSLEWKSDVNAAAIPYGLLVRTWELVGATAATSQR